MVEGMTLDELKQVTIGYYGFTPLLMLVRCMRYI